MNTIDKIRAEIKKRRLHFNKEAEKYQALNNGYSQNCYGARDALRDLENFLDTLDEPEQPTMGYDEAYLNEKIAKASKSWEGVDVDKFMDEVRGREPVSDNLEEEVKLYYSENFSYITSDNPTLSILTNIARHFAEWQKEQYTREMVMSDGSYFQKCYELGKKDMKEQMMKGAVEGIVEYNFDKNSKGYYSIRPTYVEECVGEKVKIIIEKEDEQ